jgi:hypothetical protein
MDLGAKNNVYRFNPGKAIPIFLPLRPNCDKKWYFHAAVTSEINYPFSHV